MTSTNTPTRPSGSANDDFGSNMLQDIMKGLGGETNTATLQLYQELGDIFRFIQQVKVDLQNVHVEEINDTHIPVAAIELDMVVGATEEATSIIMDNCEAIEGVATKLQVGNAGLAEELNHSVTAIYEACSFQDLTGQRITKVVKALKHIEAKVETLLQMLGAGVASEDAVASASGSASGKGVSPTQSINPNPNYFNDPLLNGPQDAKDAISQDDIDKLLEF